MSYFYIEEDKTRKMGGSTPGPIAGDVEITEKGRREYKSRCEQQ